MKFLVGLFTILALAIMPISVVTLDAVANAVDTLAEFKTLIGVWTRTRGGYQITIHDVDRNGDMWVRYWNPRTERWVNVSAAKASIENGKIIVHIKLYDPPNYPHPGSDYDLVFNPASDTLAGVYYQALNRISFGVTFTREK